MYERITLMLGRVATFKLSDLRREEGQGVTEYGIALGFVAIVVAGLLLALGSSIQTFFTNVGTALGNLPNDI